MPSILNSFALVLKKSFNPWLLLCNLVFFILLYVLIFGSVLVAMPIAFILLISSNLAGFIALAIVLFLLLFFAQNFFEGIFLCIARKVLEGKKISGEIFSETMNGYWALFKARLGVYLIMLAFALILFAPLMIAVFSNLPQLVLLLATNPEAFALSFLATYLWLIIIPLLVLFIVFFFFTPFIMLFAQFAFFEKLSFIQTMKKTWESGKKFYWHLLGIAFLFGFVLALASIALQFASSFLDKGAVNGFFGTIFSLVFSFWFTGVSSLLAVKLYFTAAESQSKKEKLREEKIVEEKIEKTNEEFEKPVKRTTRIITKKNLSKK